MAALYVTEVSTDLSQKILTVPVPRHQSCQVLLGVIFKTSSLCARNGINFLMIYGF